MTATGGTLLKPCGGRDTIEIPVLDPQALAHLTSKYPVAYISGATGPKAHVVNGLYEPMEQPEEGECMVYLKRSNEGPTARVMMEHRADAWQIKPLRFSGTDACTACVVGGCALEACSTRVWSVLEGWLFVDQPHVKMLIGAQAEYEVSPCAMPSRHRQRLELH